MAEEEKNHQDETPEEAAEPEASEETAEPEAAEEPQAEAGEEAEGGSAGASDEVAEQAEEPPAPSEPEPAADVAEGEDSGEEVLTPKQLRKRERSRASGPPGPQRSVEERASERAERRRGAGEGRRRYRTGRRAKRGEPGTGTPPASREPGSKKVRQGRVVSAAADKTITVEIAVVRRHATYEKVVRRTSKVRAHDESNAAQEGDVVRVIESRPTSRAKRWRLLEVLERAR